MTHAVRRLEARGLVSRTAGVVDRRQRIIAVTEEGSALTRRLMITARDLEADALADAGDLNGFVRRLRRLTEAVDTRSQP